MYVPKAAALRCVLLRARTGWSDVFMLGAKNAIFAPFIYKTIILPRPAQDQLRENSKKSGVLRSGGGGRAWDGVLWCLGEWREASVVTAKHRCGAKQQVPIDYFIRRVMVPSLSWQSISSTLCKPPFKVTVSQ